MDEFYNRMKETRIKAEKSQKETADFLKISQQQYSLYENGKRYIPIDLLKKFCEYLNCSADYILGLERGTREHTDNCTKYTFLCYIETKKSNTLAAAKVLLFSTSKKVTPHDRHKYHPNVHADMHG